MSERCHFVKGDNGERVLIPVCWGSVMGDGETLKYCTCSKVSDAMWKKAGEAFEQIVSLAPKKDREAKAEWMRAVADWLTDAASRIPYDEPDGATP